MKLIRCKSCNDIVRLVHTKWRQCACKKSGGQYNDDNISATVGGDCEVLGISNDWVDGSKKDRENKELNNITQGEYLGDVQIHRIKSGKGPKLKMDIKEIDDDTNKLTFKDKRKYEVNVKGGDKSPDTLEVPSNKQPSFKEHYYSRERSYNIV